MPIGELTDRQTIMRVRLVRLVMVGCGSSGHESPPSAG